MKKKDDKQSMAIKNQRSNWRKSRYKRTENIHVFAFPRNGKNVLLALKRRPGKRQTANGNHGKGLFTWPKEDVFRTSAKSLYWKFTLCLIKVKLHREKSWNVHNQEECWDYFLEQTFKHLRRFFLTIFCELGRYTVLIVFKICNLVFFALDLIIYTRSILMLLI